MKRCYLSLAAATILLVTSSQANSNPAQAHSPPTIEAESASLEERILEIPAGHAFSGENKLVSPSELADFKKKGISLQEIFDIASFKKDDISIFCHGYFLDYISNGGTYKNLLKLDMERTSQGLEPVNDDLAVASVSPLLSESKNSASKKKCPSLFEKAGGILGKDGKPVYDKWDIETLCNKSVSLSQARAYAKSVVSEKGYPFFNGEQIVEYIMEGGTTKYASNFIKKLALEPRDLIEFKRMNADVEKFTRFVKDTGMDVSTAAYYFALGVDTKEKMQFIDTPKPNALIVYGRFDPDGAMRNKAERLTLDKLRTAYDVRVLVAGEKKEIYQAAEKIPDIMLLGINRHLSGLSVSGTGELSPNSESRGYIGKLNPAASIYIATCSIYDKENSDSLVSWAQGRTVYSTSDAVSSAGVVIESLIPFRMKFYSSRGSDITVINNGSMQKSSQ